MSGLSALYDESNIIWGYGHGRLAHEKDAALHLRSHQVATFAKGREREAWMGAMHDQKQASHEEAWNHCWRVYGDPRQSVALARGTVSELHTLFLL